MKIDNFLFSRIILDASVLIKPFLKETDFEKTIKIMNWHKEKKLTILAPSLIYFELGNIISRKIPQEGALKALKSVKNLSLGTIDLDFDEEKKALALINKYPKTSFYDASYHILAKAFDATFITADEQYFQETKKEENIVLLKNIEL